MDSPLPLAHPPAWHHALRARVLTLWPIKAAANTVGMAVFFAAYFWVLRHPRQPVTVMPLTVFDQWVAFEPAALPLYLSLWLYVSLPLALLRCRRELVAYGGAALLLSGVGLGLFIAFPTALPASGIDWSRFSSLAYLKAVDVGDNACPSLHVAFAVFSAVWLDRLLRDMNAGMLLRTLNGAWCLGIVYSTLAIRQHVALDVLAGTVLGLLVVAAQALAELRVDPLQQVVQHRQ